MAKKSSGATRRESPTPRFFQDSTALSRVLREVSCLSRDTERRTGARVRPRPYLFCGLCVRLAYAWLSDGKARLRESPRFLRKKVKGALGK